MIVGATVGVAITLAALTLLRGDGQGEGAPVAAVRPACGVSIVLFELPPLFAHAYTRSPVRPGISQ